MTDKQHCGHECMCYEYFEKLMFLNKKHGEIACDGIISDGTSDGRKCNFDTRTHPIDLSTVPKKAMVEELAKREDIVKAITIDPHVRYVICDDTEIYCINTGPAHILVVKEDE